MLDLDQFKKLLTAGDAASANKLVEEALSSGISPSRIYLNVLLPAHIEHTKQTKNESGQSIAFFEMQRLCEMIKPLRKLGLNALVCGLDKDRYYYKVSSDCLFIDGTIYKL